MIPPVPTSTARVLDPSNTLPYKRISKPMAQQAEMVHETRFPINIPGWLRHVSVSVTACNAINHAGAAKDSTKYPGQTEGEDGQEQFNFLETKADHPEDIFDNDFTFPGDRCEVCTSCSSDSMPRRSASPSRQPIGALSVIRVSR